MRPAHWRTRGGGGARGGEGCYLRRWMVGGPVVAFALSLLVAAAGPATGRAPRRGDDPGRELKLSPDARLVCFDAALPWPLADGAADLVFCHDAFYFLPDKPHVASEMQRVSSGPVLVGHAHNALVSTLSSGSPMEPAGYAALFGTPLLYDDAELTRALVESRAPVPAPAAALAAVEAVSMAAGCGAPRAVRGGLAVPPPGAPLRRNPLYQPDTVVWPSPRYEQEYAALATYPMTAEGPLAGTAGDAGTDTLVRRRVLLDLPAAW